MVTCTDRGVSERGTISSLNVDVQTGFLSSLRTDRHLPGRSEGWTSKTVPLPPAVLSFLGWPSIPALSLPASHQASI